MGIRPFYYLREGISNLLKNKTNTAGSIFVMTFTFAILGVVFMIVMNINALVKDTQSTFDEITIFLVDELNSEGIDQMYDDLLSIKGVTSVIFEDKETAFNKWKEEDWEEDAHLLDGIGDSPLPNAFYIKVEDISVAKSVVAEIEKLNGVEGTKIEEIKYYRDEVQDMLTFGKFIAKMGLGVIVVLLILCFFVISNTIKIAVNSRHLEINIMKFVGAKNRFIRGPFIMEGILIGLISAVFSSVLIYFLYMYVVTSFGFDKVTAIDGSHIFSVVDPMQLMNTFVFIVLVLGIGIGTLGSISSTRKHLEV